MEVPYTTFYISLNDRGLDQFLKTIGFGVSTYLFLLTTYGKSQQVMSNLALSFNIVCEIYKIKVPSHPLLKICILS